MQERKLELLIFALAKHTLISQGRDMEGGGALFGISECAVSASLFKRLSTHSNVCQMAGF